MSFLTSIAKKKRNSPKRKKKFENCRISICNLLIKFKKINDFVHYTSLLSSYYHLFFFGAIFGICFDFVSQNGMCLLAAVSSNFLPQKSHFTLVSISYYSFFASNFYSSVVGTFFACFMLALKAKLCCFHFGTLTFYSFFVWACFSTLVFFVFVGGLSNPSAYGALWAAELKAFLLDWKTFWQTFSCFGRTLTLNILPHPIEH